ncbi:MAG TPA: enoyl-CoA hydratase/isomerase family protein [Acidimicrobiales bacterium]|jgi:enoyl-CoA hydratase/carnithine racemase
MIDVTKLDGVSVLRMTDGENRLNGPFVSVLATALDDAADPGGPVVLTGTGKFFCYGLDLDWLGAAPPDEARQMFRSLYGVLARLLRFPGATVAAVNGHAFGAGAILATAADYRVQRADRGYFCFPEVDLGLSMSDEFDAVLRAKLPTGSVLQGLLTGRRYGGEAAQAAGFVDAVATEEALVDTAVGLLRDLVGKTPATVAAIKAQQHKVPLAILEAGS